MRGIPPEYLTGGCQCGAVRYRITAPPQELAVCHCRACQKQSGSAFGMSLSFAPDAFVLTAGDLAEWRTVADSGRDKVCSFCPTCGSRIHHRSEGGLSVKAGTLDDTSWLRPDGHWWIARKQPWVMLEPDVQACLDDG